MRIKRGRRLLGLSAVMGLVLVAGQWSAHADESTENRPYPGLPQVTFVQGGWGSVTELGMGETAKARQWVRIPAAVAAIWGGTDSTENWPEPDVVRRQHAKGDAAFVSPPGYGDGYGYMAPMVVRTVGFGMVPVEATVQVSQRRDAEGLPIPFHAETVNDNMRNGDWVFHPAHISDAVEVHVSKIVVDGVDLGLTGDCRTVKPAPLEMTGPGFTISKADQDAWRPAGGGAMDIIGYLATLDPATYFHPTYGGQLEGTIDIPAFTGCTTSAGDDLSAMITASTAGPGNRAIFRTSNACSLPVNGVQWPPAPGQNTPERLNVNRGDNQDCATPNLVPYPAGAN